MHTINSWFKLALEHHWENKRLRLHPEGKGRFLQAEKGVGAGEDIPVGEESKSKDTKVKKVGSKL